MTVAGVYYMVVKYSSSGSAPSHCSTVIMIATPKYTRAVGQPRVSPDTGCLEELLRNWNELKLRNESPHFSLGSSPRLISGDQSCKYIESQRT